MLGLQRGAVELVAYTPIWATLFQSERARIQHALGADALDIQHIGSTAVPGLAAKPILDLGIAVATDAVVPACVSRLVGIGYTYRGYRGPDQGHFFDLGPEQKLTHYLHLLTINQPAWTNYLQFRDYLVAHSATRDAYMRLKQDLATQYADNRAAYTAAKATFVQQILAAAHTDARKSSA
ncbi:MAG TPA: GrpB family protein [Roseiflexaceae bacterium]|nr:GrpB family protein [Roseiflexaceae bacterium]